MTTFLLGMLAGFLFALVLAVIFVQSLMSACNELTRDMSATIERLRDEVNTLKQEKPLTPGWDRDCERWKWGNN